MTIIASEDFVRASLDEAFQSRGTFNQARYAETETATTEPLGANLNLDGAEDPTEALKVVQLRINDLERFVNIQAGLINALIDVLQAAGLADG